MPRIVETFRRPPTGRIRDRNGGLPRLSGGVAHASRCPASPQRTLKAENLGKPSLWVMISDPWYKGRGRPCRRGRHPGRSSSAGLEQRNHNPRVGGSSPSSATKHMSLGDNGWAPLRRGFFVAGRRALLLGDGGGEPACLLRACAGRHPTACRGHASSQVTARARSSGRRSRTVSSISALYTGFMTMMASGGAWRRCTGATIRCPEPVV